MDKQHILDEIKRTAVDGVALGVERFETVTGIGKRDWWGKHWRSWGDAVAEAGCEASGFNVAYSDDFILEKLVLFIRDLGRYPSVVDFKMRAHSQRGFPHHNAFQRLGRKPVLVQKAAAFCRNRSGLDDVLAICEATAESEKTASTAEAETKDTEFGFVYLFKMAHQPHYKLGKTNSIGRREYELAIQLPEKLTIIHSIKTDDPQGIEKYWHERFHDRRTNGEWFKLSPSDVVAFKRRKFM